MRCFKRGDCVSIITTGADRFLLTFSGETPMTTSSLSLERFPVSRQVTKAWGKLALSTRHQLAVWSYTSLSCSCDFPFGRYIPLPVQAAEAGRDQFECGAQMKCCCTAPRRTLLQGMANTAFFQASWLQLEKAQLTLMRHSYTEHLGLKQRNYHSPPVILGSKM